MKNSRIKHNVEIGIKKPDSNQVLAIKKITLRDKFINAIFGAGHHTVVLVPGDSIGTISITEMEVHEIKNNNSNF